jgi:hypothetical protein
MLYDQLVYPLIFWDGTGGCGIQANGNTQKASTLIRKSLISLILQPCGHFLHQMSTLREEFICAVSGRLFNLRIKYLAMVQKRQLAKENKIRDQNPTEKEYGVRTFIPPSFTDSDEYWHRVATKCVALSGELGSPTFFLTFTMT